MIKKKVVKGRPRHYIVGVVIKEREKYLLLERNNFPYGFASSAGHVNNGEKIKDALSRELKEELGLEIIKAKEIFRGVISLNPCRYDGTYDHMAYIFEVKTKGRIKIDKSEFKNYNWYSKNEISNLDLEPMWRTVFSKIKEIKWNY